VESGGEGEGMIFESAHTSIELLVCLRKGGKEEGGGGTIRGELAVEISGPLSIVKPSDQEYWRKANQGTPGFFGPKSTK